MTKLLALVGISLFVVGCSTAPKTIDELSGSTTPHTSSAISTAVVGSSVIIDGSDYRVIDRYTAASGRQCRKLLGARAVVQVSCESNSGSWYVRDPLGSTAGAHGAGPVLAQEVTIIPTSLPDSSHPSTSVPKALNNAEVDLSELDDTNQISASEASTSGVLRAGETLWKFSRRATGTATNWHAIAEYNGVVDVKGLAAGDELAIPPGINVRPDFADQ